MCTDCAYTMWSKNRKVDIDFQTFRILWTEWLALLFIAWVDMCVCVCAVLCCVVRNSHMRATITKLFHIHIGCWLYSHCLKIDVDVEIKTIAQVTQTAVQQKKPRTEWLHFCVWVDWDAASNGDGFGTFRWLAFFTGGVGQEQTEPSNNCTAFSLWI